MLGCLCPQVGIKFCPLPWALGPRGEVAPYQCLEALGGLADAGQPEADFANDLDRVQQHDDSGIHQQGVRSSLQGSELRDYAPMRVGNTDGCPAASNFHRLEVDSIADYLSQYVVDPMQWMMDRQMVRHLFEMWGRPQIDLFVSACNTHLPLWYGHTYHPEAIALDVLLQSWTGLSLYALLLLPKTLSEDLGR